jgi:hypothetical protein
MQTVRVQASWLGYILSRRGLQGARALSGLKMYECLARGEAEPKLWPEPDPRMGQVRGAHLGATTPGQNMMVRIGPGALHGYRSGTKALLSTEGTPILWYRHSSFRKQE